MVPAECEAEVPTFGAVQSELIRIREVTGVAVGRGQQRHDGVTGTDVLAAEVEVHAGDPGDELAGAGQPHGLVDGAGDQGWVLPELGELGRVAAQQHEAGRHELGEGLVAARDQDYEVGRRDVESAFGRVSGEARRSQGVRQRTDQVGAAGTALRGVSAQRRPGLLQDRYDAAVLDVGQRSDTAEQGAIGVGPLPELLDVVLQPQPRRVETYRRRSGEARHDVDRSAVGQLGQQLAHDRGDDRFPGGGGGPGERGLERVADLGVVRGVDEQQLLREQLDDPPDLTHAPRVEAFPGVTAAGGELVRVPQHGRDLGVAGAHPHLGALVPVHGRKLTQGSVVVGRVGHDGGAAHQEQAVPRAIQAVGLLQSSSELIV